jgi:hypothetical protein
MHPVSGTVSIESEPPLSLVIAMSKATAGWQTLWTRHEGQKTSDGCGRSRFITEPRRAEPATASGFFATPLEEIRRNISAETGQYADLEAGKQRRRTKDRSADENNKERPH